MPTPIEIHLMLPSQSHNNREIRQGIYQYALPNRQWIFIFLDQSVQVLKALKTNRRSAGLIGRLGSAELAAAAEDLKIPVINIHGGDPLCGLPTLGPPDLVARQSTSALQCRDTIVAKALQLINENAFAPLGIEELARQTGASRRNLEKRFRAVLNRTPIQEQNRIRLEEVKRLIRHDPRTIEQISEMCGFSSPVYLNQFFHREAGMSPGSYRKAFGDFFGGR